MPTNPTIDPRFMYWGSSKGDRDLAIPFPSSSSGVFETSRAVDSARNANNVVVGQMVGRSVAKQNMTWAALPCDIWWEMNNWVEEHGMFFWCHYFDHCRGRWDDRRFYCGNFKCTPSMVDPDTGIPKYYKSCSVNVIDTGE